jgi:hypothetical protein
MTALGAARLGSGCFRATCARSRADETRVAEDARFDGLYVLRTNTKLTRFCGR